MPPLATVTDNINDTVCYAEIVRLVQKLSQENHFNLIEYLAVQIYDIIYQNFIESKLEKIFLNVTVTKLKSSVSGVHGGVSFSYSGKGDTMIYISIGSNLGNRLVNIKKALNLLKSCDFTT
ncbi:dihydroneopterin aldolase [Rickettsia rhipicephali]|uniref:dihydroneopterin aldolase n=1 Tax=Rickettsia rhipicephali TaxID=33992 RepID=UPI00224C932D|nr:dihydroneopterin aldolase [Rickettsia rhipicephali]